MSFWQPMASLVTIAPEISRFLISSGIAVISFDLLSQACCPRSRRFSVAQALTICRGPLPAALSKDRRAVLPSMATTRPSVDSATACTHLTNPSCKARGLSSAKTRPKVSWEGMPLASSRKVRRNSSLLTPYLATSTQESAPEMTAKMVTAMISQRLCNRKCSRRGSATSAKHSRMETVVALDMILLLRERVPSEKNHSHVHLSKSRAQIRIPR